MSAAGAANVLIFCGLFERKHYCEIYFSAWMLWGDHSLSLLNGLTQVLLAEGHPFEQIIKQLYLLIL